MTTTPSPTPAPASASQRPCAPAARAPRRPRAALTLVELLLALVILAVMGVAIAQMLSAVSYATASRNDIRASLARQAALAARLDQAIRTSRMILQTGSNYVVLWMADTDNDGLPNVAEIRRVEYDATNRRLVSYKASFPAAWSASDIAAVNLSYALSANFNTLTAGLKSSGYFPAEVWSRNIQGMTLSLNGASAQTSTLLSYRLTQASGVYSQTLVGAAATRTQ